VGIPQVKYWGTRPLQFMPPELKPAHMGEYIISWLPGGSQHLLVPVIDITEIKGYLKPTVTKIQA